ncbi:hypothetical protein HU200_053800 [Digitaria exilis]|uniref:Uncharacterized protein n=1 Tax=Digitaria exilis TaxID=1010633 RepID=A0A835E4P3_9POAL|nr:hypothetical protein HU200_053800 [Digitaria exilis]
MLRQRGYGQYPSVEDAHGPVPPALPVPNCCCGVPAEVKQSRHPKTAGRAYYIYFFQWIDGPEKFDLRIRLFPYESEKLVPYHEFRRWVAPPPNPPPMTVDERMAAARRRRKDPLLCHYSRPKYSPFFRCSIKTMDGWPVCQFNEYVQGPRSVWPSDEEVRAYEVGQAPWPCTKYPEKRCKCGILAERGVVPSELGYGWYYGNRNAFWVSDMIFMFDLSFSSSVLHSLVLMKRYCLRRRAGHVIGNGSVVVMSLLLG